jgi:hypothetical protein
LGAGTDSNTGSQYGQQFNSLRLNSKIRKIIKQCIKDTSLIHYDIPFPQPKEYEWDTDSLWHMRWEWVVNEMIFAFEKLNEDDWEAEFFANKEWNKEEWTKVSDRIQNGLILFGKYYRGLWT